MGRNTAEGEEESSGLATGHGEKQQAGISKGPQGSERAGRVAGGGAEGSSRCAQPGTKTPHRPGGQSPRVGTHRVPTAFPPGSDPTRIHSKSHPLLRAAFPVSALPTGPEGRGSEPSPAQGLSGSPSRSALLPGRLLALSQTDSKRLAYLHPCGFRHGAPPSERAGGQGEPAHAGEAEPGEASRRLPQHSGAARVGGATARGASRWGRTELPLRARSGGTSGPHRRRARREAGGARTTGGSVPDTAAPPSSPGPAVDPRPPAPARPSHGLDGRRGAPPPPPRRRDRDPHSLGGGGCGGRPGPHSPSTSSARTAAILRTAAIPRAGQRARRTPAMPPPPRPPSPPPGGVPEEGRPPETGRGREERGPAGSARLGPPCLPRGAPGSGLAGAIPCRAPPARGAGRVVPGSCASPPAPASASGVPRATGSRPSSPPAQALLVAGLFVKAGQELPVCTAGRDPVKAPGQRGASHPATARGLDTHRIALRIPTHSTLPALRCSSAGPKLRHSSRSWSGHLHGPDWSLSVRANASGGTCCSPAPPALAVVTLNTSFPAGLLSLQNTGFGTVWKTCHQTWP